MSRFTVISLLSLITISATVKAQTHFNATTTLTAETSNNTSASDTFSGQHNGNIAAGNVSKVPIQSLLSPGSSAKVYAHLVQWFGYGDHVDVGYVSGDALQVQKQVKDMISRGLDGAIIDWYGRGNESRNFHAYDQGTQQLMQEAEKHPGFSFALMADVGANKSCAGTRDCDPTENLIADLNYAYRTYEQSSAYLRYDQRPVIFFFGFDGHAIDWHLVRTRVAGDPILVFRNSGAFRHQESNGGFSWVAPEYAGAKDPMALDYLDNYYQTAGRTGGFFLGSAYKGFNDSIALWGANRLINQQCGQTWLQSIAEANQFYSEQQPMFGIQLVTWNDYEEGTEFESGIENCVNLTSSTQGTSVYWKIQENSATIDHFTIFISRDGENLMPIADLAADARSLDLAKFSLDPGDYTTYVKAIGKPSLINEMSEGHRLTISAGFGAATSVASAGLQVSSSTSMVPASVSVNAGNGQETSGEVLIDFGDGTVVTGQTTTQHIYKLPGVYTVMVTVTDQKGQQSTQTQLVTITDH